MSSEMNLIVGTCCNTMQRNGVPLNLDSLMFEKSRRKRGT